MANTLMVPLTDWDLHAWQLIHVQWRNGLLDAVAPILRHPPTWIPLYLFLIIFVPYRFGKSALYWCLGYLLCFGIGDYTSASIIKPLVARVRPCNDPNLQAMLHRLVDCGSGYSFPSAHATNHFAMAAFIAFTLGRFYPWIKIPLFIWAFSVAYAQVYVGVHFPGDVFFGAILGTAIGCVVAQLMNHSKKFTLVPKSR